MLTELAANRHSAELMHAWRAGVKSHLAPTAEALTPAISGSPRMSMGHVPNGPEGLRGTNVGNLLMPM